MGDRKTLATQVGEDSQLYRDFQEYQQDYANKSEALRHAIRDGIDTDAVTQEDLQRALEESKAEAQVGAWESGALTSAFLLASIAIAFAVSTILPFVPSFEGIATASILLAAAVGVLIAVKNGTVEQFERRFGSHDAGMAALAQEVAE
jgi:high-affinity nickel permease